VTFKDFTRAEWAALRAATPLTLAPEDLGRIRGLNDRLSQDGVEQVYLPISRLLNLQVAAVRQLHRATDTFLGRPSAPRPFVIGIAGSVAAGKSTTARLLQELLSRWPDHPRVDLVTTDGFLYPNTELEARGLMDRKGFPESYDRRRLLAFVGDLRAGLPRVSAPVYSHLASDIVPGAEQVVGRPDIVIVEGLNVLQAGDGRPGAEAVTVVSDFFDFAIFVDVDEADVERWYVERFLALRDTVFQDPQSYFHRYAALTDSEAADEARRIWRTINLVNLRTNIAPTRDRADLILEKGPDHSIRRMRLRR